MSGDLKKGIKVCQPQLKYFGYKGQQSCGKRMGDFKLNNKCCTTVLNMVNTATEFAHQITKDSVPCTMQIVMFGALHRQAYQYALTN